MKNLLLYYLLLITFYTSFYSFFIVLFEHPLPRSNNKRDRALLLLICIVSEQPVPLTHTRNLIFSQSE